MALREGLEEIPRVVADAGHGAGEHTTHVHAYFNSFHFIFELPHAVARGMSIAWGRGGVAILESAMPYFSRLWRVSCSCRGPLRMFTSRTTQGTEVDDESTGGRRARAVGIGPMPGI